MVQLLVMLGGLAALGLAVFGWVWGSIVLVGGGAGSRDPWLFVWIGLGGTFVSGALCIALRRFGDRRAGGQPRHRDPPAGGG